MTAPVAAPDRTYDPVRFHRGTRGFAAFVTIINGLAVLAFGAAVVPSAHVGAPLGAWLAIAGIAAGIAHLVAVVGLIRGRAWSGRLVAYLAAGGIGAAVFAILLITRASEAVLGAADASTVGFLAWMIGSWLVATRFALKPFRPVAVPTPDVEVVAPAPHPALVRRPVLGAAAA